MNGWGPKRSVCPSKPRETKLFPAKSKRGRDRKCHKLSQIVVTFYDEFHDNLRRFMSANCRDVFSPVPFPPSFFGFRRFLAGCPGSVAGSRWDIPGASEKLEKKSLCSVFGPLSGCHDFRGPEDAKFQKQLKRSRLTFKAELCSK